MALFALPKTLTDLVKAFKSAAAGRVLRKGPAGWEFLDPSQTWASQGIFVGAAEPELVSYAQWAATGEGYWAWVDVSSAVGSIEATSSGGAVLSGSSPVAASRPVLSSGGAVLSGSPLVSCGALTAGSGGPVLSGSATVSMGSAGSVIVSSMGGIVSGGVSVPLRGVVILPAGGAILSGSALSAKGSATASAGGAVLSGTASVAGSAGAAQVSVASTGGAVLSGAAAQSSGRVSATSGGVVMSGAASVESAAGASAPTQPVISATGGDTTVTITKTSGGTGTPPITYALKWRLAVASGGDGIWSAYSDITLDGQNKYVKTGLTNGSTYDFMLKATNAQGFAESAEASANAGVAAPVTLSFETADIIDSTGATWAKEIFAAVNPGDVAGSITSGVAGGDTGNALAIVGGYYDDGELYGPRASYIIRTMNIAAGVLSVRFKRQDTLLDIKINGNSYASTGTVGVWITYTITVPSPLTNAVIKIGCAGIGTASLIDNVSIPQ